MTITMMRATRAVDPTAQTVPACFPRDSRLSEVDLCTCSLTRTCPKWGHILLYTWGTTSFPRHNQGTNSVPIETGIPGKDEKNMAMEVQESNGKKGEYDDALQVGGV